jgi:CubicO group peptidase (beta-lactamase class C family)
MIVEAIATDASGKTGTELLNEYFFGPMNLDDIASGVPAASFMDRSAWHHLNNTPSAVRYVWPWTFGGGVRASARDYAEMMIIALNGGKDSNGVQRVTSSRLADMLTGANGAGYGLFFEGGSTAAEGTDRSFVHNGRHSEGAYTRMCGNPTRNEGIVILANTQLGGTPIEGLDPALFNDILDAYVAAMGWPAGLNCR